MLTSLHIENIAVVKCADIEFERGFTVLTGETGAGKSIIIDSINLLLGARPSKELIRSGESMAMVAALFTDMTEENIAALMELGVSPDENGEILLQRSISADGKAQTRLNGRALAVSVQREIGRLLLNIHGQHENQTLLQASRHIVYLDKYSDAGELLTKYAASYEALMETKKKIASLTRDEQEKARLIELLKYQIADIDAAKLKPNEEDSLLTLRKRIQNIEKVVKQVKIVYRALYQNEKGASAYGLIRIAESALTQISDVLPETEAYLEKLNNFMYEIEDIARTVYGVVDDDIGNPSVELDRIESRLDAIQKLKRKYGSTVGEILEFRRKAEADLAEIETSDEQIEELDQTAARLLEQTGRYAAELTERRKAAAEELERRIMEELSFLEMAKVRFHVSMRHTNFTRQGADEVEFMISTNPGEPLKPLGKIASGGELSRVMLAMKSALAGKESTETLIFDEIDTGVSGKTSQKIGIKLKHTAETAQVVCVTHSAQIASLAHNHLLISKAEHDGRVETTVITLSPEERVHEIARIMGGAEITEMLLDTAREMRAAAENM